MISPTPAWFDRARATLEEHSAPAAGFEDLIAQWDFTGEVYDFKEDQEDAFDKIEYPPCQLCGYEHIRWGYVIKNIVTKHTLIVGSVCICHFKLATSSELHRLVEQKERQYRSERIYKALEQLPDDSFLTYYLTRGAFTPNQAAYAFKKMSALGIPFDKRDFRVKIRRKREKAQIPGTWREIAECLTPKQWEVVYRLVPGARYVRDQYQGPAGGGSA